MVSLKDNSLIDTKFSNQMECAIQSVKLSKPSFLNKNSGLNAFYDNSDDEGDVPEPYEKDICKFTDLANFSGELCDDDDRPEASVDDDLKKFFNRNKRDEDQESDLSHHSKKSGSEKSKSSRNSKKGGTRKKKEKILLALEEY